MADTTVSETEQGKPSMADQSVEAAVRRLTDLGMSRRDALQKIHDALGGAVSLLNSAGIGWTSSLRQMNLSAGMKLNTATFEEATNDADRTVV